VNSGRVQHNLRPADPVSPGPTNSATLSDLNSYPLFTGPLDSLTEQAGFTYGMAAQGVDDVKGVLQLMWLQQTWHTRLAFYLSAHRAVRLGQATDQQYELVVGVAQTAESLSALVQTSWNLWQAVQQSQWGTIMAAAGGDLEEAWAQSETCRWLAVYMEELMVALNNQYQESSAFKRGEIKGRITLEVAMIVLPFTKAANAAQLSKVALLTRLSEVAWIRENPQLLNLILRVLELAKGQQAVPPVIGLPPPRLPPPLVANAEVGGAAERIWGRMTAQMAEGKPRRVALMEAMSEAVANAGDSVVTLRFKEMQDLLLARAPQQFATREEAAQFLADLLTYSDWKASMQGKQLLVVLTDTADEFGVLGGKAGTFRGHHILKRQMLRVLQEQYGVPVGDLDGTPVKIFQWAEHQGPGPNSFHNRLNAWNDGVLSDRQLPFIKNTPGGLYEHAYQVLDEYIRFLDHYAEYRELIPVVRSYAKAHGIPTTL